MKQAENSPSSSRQGKLTQAADEAQQARSAFAY